MAGWRAYWQLLRQQLSRIPLPAWLAIGAVLMALVIVFSIQLSGPTYVALYDGLSPADGGKVIAKLQKLGISYQLQAEGNIILVPAASLATARLQLGDAGIPSNTANDNWTQLENAPMTISDLAQNTMASRALEASLAQSIGEMDGITSAEVFLALPPNTPFLADQPKPSASVIITANPQDAARQGPVIAKLVAGAVTGLSVSGVSVTTNSGLAVFPLSGTQADSSQFALIADIENQANSRVAQLLLPLVGNGNFRSDVTADLDFTKAHIHQISYGPTRLVSHEVSSNSSQDNSQTTAIGIPGAMSNQPPSATTAALPAASDQAASANSKAAAVTTPKTTSQKLDQTYITDESDNDIVKPDWVVKSISVSVVVNQAALGNVTADQMKAAIAAAFAYPNVHVNVLATSFKPADASVVSYQLLPIIAPFTRAVLVMLGTIALLLGFAVPFGRRLATVGTRNQATSLPTRPLPVTLPPPDFSALRDVARGNPAGVARLLQSWADEHE
ncbi:MAG: flagellar M-ring protein FliF [Acidocella sp. 20-57-95]|nr:MAG: flagellar M-ring protein FliF [Acidocella sp. 20-57-95]OYV57933.1 MAG: flagellar M-ring protein FliF [Acidocella sp. 21-58-7]HQT63566.1 flagellar basal-body MS-ring/collar protein FliF [Acidocella sp.]